LQRWGGGDLLAGPLIDVARQLWEAPFVLVSHDNAPDPIFSYGNRTALALFELDWHAFTQLPSRLSAEPPNRDERQQLLAQVNRQGYVKGYSGVRIAAGGRRFVIEDVTLWNVVDDGGHYRGQAATYSRWRYLS
ncbi:MAG: MEKHLA domain-containing protein, partial [Candidatus Competibacterales bacterium]